MPKRRKVVVVVLATWLSTFLVGAAIGKRVSPDLSKEDEVKRYIAGHLRRPWAGADLSDEIIFACGKDRYGWNLTKASFDSTIRSGLAFTKSRSLLRDLAPSDLGAVAAMVGFTQSKTLREFWRSIHKVRSSSGTTGYVAIVAGIVTGAVLGFWWQYEPDPDCGSAGLQRVANDQVFWQQLADVVLKQRAESGGRTPP